VPRPRAVLIAGASVAGPTLAHWLERFGMEPTVVERAPELRVGGQNVDVRGAGRIVAARTGVEEAVRAAGTGERGLAFVDARGAVQAEFPAASRADAGRAGDGPTAELEILRGDLAQILHDHTRDRVRYRFGDRITRLDDDGHRVRVGFERGHEEEFDLVIAADGLHSGTRAITLPQRRDVRFLGLCLAYFTIPREESDDDWWRWYAAGGGRTVTLRPDRHGTTRAMLSFLSLSPAAARLSPDAQRELLRAEFRGAGWEAERVLDGMDRAADFYFEAISQVRPPCYANGRVGLVGDAAWCASPISGMGTTLALLGAYVLAGSWHAATTTVRRSPLTNRSCGRTCGRPSGSRPAHRASPTPAATPACACSTPRRGGRPGWRDGCLPSAPGRSTCPSTSCHARPPADQAGGRAHGHDQLPAPSIRKPFLAMPLSC